MKKIITFISLCSMMTAFSADQSSVDGSYELLSTSSYKFGSNYTVTSGVTKNSPINSTDYSLFPSSDADLEVGSVWLGVQGKYGEFRVGSHDSLDNLAVAGANQQLNPSAYDLLVQDESGFSQSLTYIGKVGAVVAGAQFATDASEEKNNTTGFILNAQSRSMEAAIAYRKNSDEAKAVKGRLTYKSRNNSRVRLDLIAEKVAVGSGSSSAENDSTLFMLGAKYSVTPKAYVVGQYGVVGFGDDVDLSLDELPVNKDFNALSLEAGYSLSDKTSIYINHTQKSYDSGLQLPFADSLEGTQTNSIGVRLNW